MRISDWISDVCSSDLDIEEILSRHGYETQDVKLLEGEKVRYIKAKSEGGHIVFIDLDRAGKVSVHPTDFSMKETPEILVSNSISRGTIGSESCRVSVCKYF